VIHEKYIDLLPVTKLRRDILKIINGYPDAKLKMENIKYYLIKSGHEDLKDNTLYKNLEFLEREKFIAGIPLPSQGAPTRPSNFYKIIETRSCSVLVSAIIRCNDPMQCPDPNCKICPNAGIKTRWQT
jgi:hypothetical protein